MENPQEANADVAMNRVRVFGRFISADNPEFDMLYGEVAEDVPVDSDDMILPVFDIAVNSQMEASQELERMITEELNDKMMSDKRLARAVTKASAVDVEEFRPRGEPTTEPVAVADVAVTPNQEGFIAKIEFDELAAQVS